MDVAVGVGGNVLGEELDRSIGECKLSAPRMKTECAIVVDGKKHSLWVALAIDRGVGATVGAIRFIRSRAADPGGPILYASWRGGAIACHIRRLTQQSGIA